jgi:fatty-acyl-CoA synthase
MRRVVNEMNCREITIAYGQTESSPVITMSSTDDSLELRVGTVGAVLPETEVKIVAPGAARPVETGVPGELCARGYLVMQGYDADPDATRHAIDPDGWLHTGDLAVMRPDGYFHIRGRIKDIVIRGGENIYPREIEEFLHGHPKILDVHVVGVPDRRLGETVLAWVRLKPGETMTAAEVRDFCKGKIAYFKVPQYVRFVDSFPLTVTGKVQKYRMREIEMEERGLKAAETA